METKLKPNYYRIAMFALILIIGILLIVKYTGKIGNTNEQNKTQNTEVKNTQQTKTEGRICSTEEPYQVSEEYQDKEPYGKKTCSQKPVNFTATPLPRTVGENNSIICRLNVTNIDEANADWSFGAYYNQPSGRIQLADQNKSVKAGESETYEWTFKVSFVNPEDNCVMYATRSPTTQKCYYAEPITYKVVNKIRTITKYKNTTKKC